MLTRIVTYALLLLATALPAHAAPRRVALELVLAVDGSASITGDMLAFQLQGHAAALADPDVGAALAAGGAALTLVAFSGPHTLRVLVPWTIVASPEDAKALAARVMAAPHDFPPDSTALGSAIDDSSALFGTSGALAGRRVLDLVSNGFSNSGPEPADARDRAVARGVTVNALAILDELPWLEGYFQENVVGGPGAFVATAADRASFVEALRRKLLSELVAALP